MNEGQSQRSPRDKVIAAYERVTRAKAALAAALEELHEAERAYRALFGPDGVTLLE